VVTVGSGPPAVLARLVHRAEIGMTLIGIDSDPSGALRRLRAERSQPLPTGVDFVWGRIESTPLRAASCDAALALDVIEHVDDDAAALAEAARVVRPGGFVLATVPALPSLWGNQDVVSHHKRRYTRRSLADAFARARLPLTWISYFNTALFPAVAAVRWSRRLLGRDGASASDFESGRPGAVNELLERVFAAERHLVGRVRLPAGVSLIAVARVRRATSRGSA
jgi:SAM-dependent methyltransferase